MIKKTQTLDSLSKSTHQHPQQIQPQKPKATNIASQPPLSYANQVKGKTGISRIIKATSYSRDGFVAAYKNEEAFRQIIWLNLFLCLGALFIHFSITIKMILILGSFISLISELFNTGIEASVDHTSTEQHPLAKVAKDVGSAAQFLALVLLFLIWVMALSDLLL